MGGTINSKQITDHWDELLRLTASLRMGTVTASLLLRKLASYPRQNGLAWALREVGRLEKTLFTLEWLQSVELRRRVQVGLNKGEARNALARAVFFYRHGRVQDRSHAQQQRRAQGLNLVVAAIILWNTLELARAVEELQQEGMTITPEQLAHLSPMDWEHIISNPVEYLPKRVAWPACAIVRMHTLQTDLISGFPALQSDPEPLCFPVPIHCSDPLTRASGARAGFALVLLSTSEDLDLAPVAPLEPGVSRWCCARSRRVRKKGGSHRSGHRLHHWLLALAGHGSEATLSWYGYLSASEHSSRCFHWNPL
jgi:hypothetical protein